MDQTLKTYLQKNTIPAKPGRKCVDGRYQPNTDSSGMIARPGADLGYAEILLALSEEKKLGLSPEECFDKIFEVLHSLDEKFYLHTDEHALHGSDPSRIGCGHAAKPMDSSLCHDYHLDSDDMKKLVIYVKKRASEDPENVVVVNLPGNHKEKAVLVNKGTTNTVNSTDGEHMFFIYDAARDEEFMKVLVEKLDIPEITYEEFKKMSDTQLTATLHNLALGKEIFEIDLDIPNSTIRSSRKIQ